MNTSQGTALLIFKIDSPNYTTLYLVLTVGIFHISIKFAGGERLASLLGLEPGDRFVLNI
jgi:hypothetical protein